MKRKKERFVFKKGDYCQYDAGSGSFGRVDELAYAEGTDWVTQRYHVQWSYGHDVNGNMMHGMSRYLRGTELQHRTRAEFNRYIEEADRGRKERNAVS